MHADTSMYVVIEVSFRLKSVYSPKVRTVISLKLPWRVTKKQAISKHVYCHMTLFESIYLPGELQKMMFPLLDWISSMNTQLFSWSHFTTVQPAQRSALNPWGGLFKKDSSSITSITNREMVFWRMLFLFNFLRTERVIVQLMSRPLLWFVWWAWSWFMNLWASKELESYS